MNSGQLADIFFQANTVKGHRYLDDAGKIMNRWDSEFPSKVVGLAGLLMSNPDATLQVLRVDNRQIWLHFHLPELKTAIEQVRSITHEICEIIGVDRFDRLGLRAQYIVGVEDVVQAVADIASTIFTPTWWDKMTQAGRPSSFELVLPISAGEQAVNLRISVVRKAAGTKAPDDLPDMGVLLDTDIFSLHPTYLDDLGRLMKKAQNWMETELPSIEENLLGGMKEWLE